MVKTINWKKKKNKNKPSQHLCFSVAITTSLFTLSLVRRFLGFFFLWTHFPLPQLRSRQLSILEIRYEPDLIVKLILLNENSSCASSMSWMIYVVLFSLQLILFRFCFWKVCCCRWLQSGMDFLWSENATTPRASHFSVAICFAFASFAARFFLDRFVFRVRSFVCLFALRKILIRCRIG